MVATQKPKWSKTLGGQTFQVGVGVGKPLPSQLFNLEPKKKVVFVTKEGDFQPFFPNYNSIQHQEVEAKEEEAWLTEVKMQRKEEERLLQLQKQKMQQELYLKNMERKQEESQRYKKEIMLDQLRKLHEERERQKAMLKEFPQNGPGNFPTTNIVFFLLRFSFILPTVIPIIDPVNVPTMAENRWLLVALHHQHITLSCFPSQLQDPM